MRPLTITSLLCALALAGPTACGDEEAAPPARSEVAGPEADPDLPDGLGAVLLRLRSRDPVSSQWRGWLTATQRDCDDDCAEPVTARLGFAEGEALELIYLLPGTWDLELEVRDLLEVPILVGRREGLRVIAGHVTTTAIDLLPAAGGVQVHARIAPGGERFTCGEAPVVVGHLREEIPVSALMRYLEGELALTGLTGAQTVGPDGELTYHLFAELEGQDRIWHQESADPTAWPDDWEETDLECRGGHIEGVTPALGGLLALCWNRWSNRIHLSFSEDGRWWEPFSTTVVSVHTDDELRACALVVDNQFNLFCSAVDRSNDFVRDRSVRDGAGGLVHAFSPDGSSWSDLLPYDPEAPDDAHEVVFDGLHYEVPRYATIGLRSLQVIHHSGLYGLWALWEHEGGRGTLVHASSVDRRHWRFGGAQSALGLGSPTVSVGTDHTCGMTPQGTAWCGGSRTWGRLGDGSFVRESRTPVRVLGDVVWQQIDAGWQHTCGVGRDGSLWCWGYNGYGQLGDGTRDFSAEPVRVGEDVDWEVVDAGATHTCAIKRNGVLWCWGRNGMGQLGDGTREARLRPVRTTGRDRWKDESAQYY